MPALTLAMWLANGFANFLLLFRNHLWLLNLSLFNIDHVEDHVCLHYRIPTIFSSKYLYLYNIITIFFSKLISLITFFFSQFYHHKACAQCKSIPKEPSLCLVCGTLVCLRENCCKEENMHEAVQVVLLCSFSMGIFNNSTTFLYLAFDWLWSRNSYLFGSQQFYYYCDSGKKSLFVGLSLFRYVWGRGSRVKVNISFLY